MAKAAPAIAAAAIVKVFAATFPRASPLILVIVPLSPPVLFKAVRPRRKSLRRESDASRYPARPCDIAALLLSCQPLRELRADISVVHHGAIRADHNPVRGAGNARVPLAASERLWNHYRQCRLFALNCDQDLPRRKGRFRLRLLAQAGLQKRRSAESPIRGITDPGNHRVIAVTLRDHDIYKIHNKPLYEIDVTKSG
jgi:hypothetical protein